MEISYKIAALYFAVLLTGLSAGLFFAWQVSVIPGTKQLQDFTYIETMQKINRAIINPSFMLIFLGPILMQLFTCFIYFQTTVQFWLILSAVLTYVAGTVIVTGLGNVPLNDGLDELKINEIKKEQLTKERNHYERKWNRLHIIRTVFAVISFMLILAAAFLPS